MDDGPNNNPTPYTLRSEEELTELARTLFDEEEMMFSDGRKWEDLEFSDMAFYRNGVRAILARLRKLRDT